MLKYIILLACSTYLTILSSTTPISSEQEQSPNSSIDIYGIEQNITTNDCKILLGAPTVYLCKRFTYLLDNMDPFQMPVNILAMRKFIISADADGTSVILQTKNHIELLKERVKQPRINFRKNESCLIARVKSRPEYTLIASIMSSSPIPEENAHNVTTNEEDEHHIQQREFLIEISLVGRASSSYRTAFPAEQLNFNLTNASFKDAVIFSDKFYGNDYFIVGLDNSTLVVFKSLFQNAEMELLTTLQIDQDFEIIKILVHDFFMLVLMKNGKQQTKVKIYRLSVHKMFHAAEQYTLYLDHAPNTNPLLQLQLKAYDEDRLALFINFPGEKIIIYKFQKSKADYAKLQLDTEYDSIEYNNNTNSVEIGYSFDYLINSQTESLNKQGILLSPITKNLGALYFIPYCLSQNYNNSEIGCLPCSKEPGTSLCTTHTQLPEALTELTEQVDFPLFSDFQCQKSVYNEQVGECLSSEEDKIINDQCSQIKDCMNCSVSQSCSWSEGSCRHSIKNETDTENNTPDYWRDILGPMHSCGTFEPCGQTLFVDSEGLITFSLSDVYKNQLCSWKIQPIEKHNYKVNLTILIEGLGQDKFAQTHTVYLDYYSYNITEGKKKDFSSNITLSESTINTEITAAELTLSIIIPQSLVGTAQSLKIRYQVNPIVSPFEDVITLFRWIYYIVFLLAALTCAVSSFRDVGDYYRRQRFINELRALGVDEAVITDEPHHAIDVEKMLQNSKLVNKVMLDGAKKIEFNQTECAICLEEFKNGDNLAEFSCKHVFHTKCFEKWAVSENLKPKIKCPVCNKALA